MMTRVVMLLALLAVLTAVATTPAVAFAQWQPSLETEPPVAATACDGGCRFWSPLDLFRDIDECDCWLNSDDRLLARCGFDCEDCNLRISGGGALRYRYFEERNRLRPPLAAGRSTYSQWRFTPWVEANCNDVFSAYVQMIDASTFGHELPPLAIDVNRWDLLQAYADARLLSLDGGDLHYRYGRQFLTYGSQHLVSPLAWANTYRNFEGHRGYYLGEDWNIDVLAVQAVNSAARYYVYNPTSADSPASDAWLGGLYATHKNFGGGSLDLYWLWSSVDAPMPNVIDGERHTVGARYAGKHALETSIAQTLTWDVEGAYQFGSTGYLGPRQDMQAGFVSLNGGITYDDVLWTPTLSGVFWWGSGDDDPTDGTNHTVSTLYPLGHAYWGMMDKFNGSNLLDYSLQVSVKPTQKLTLLTAWHWFEKAASQDAIYNIAGVPFGGVSTTPRGLGQELDLMATYQVNKNLQLQMGYFLYWYGPAVSGNPNPAIANRGDADNLYFSVDWNF